MISKSKSISVALAVTAGLAVSACSQSNSTAQVAGVAATGVLVSAATDPNCKQAIDNLVSKTPDAKVSNACLEDLTGTVLAAGVSTAVAVSKPATPASK
jgi:glycerol uptake facilitator-like aquaporin